MRQLKDRIDEMRWDELVFYLGNLPLLFLLSLVSFSLFLFNSSLTLTPLLFSTIFSPPLSYPHLPPFFAYDFLNLPIALQSFFSLPLISFSPLFSSSLPLFSSSHLSLCFPLLSPPPLSLFSLLFFLLLCRPLLLKDCSAILVIAPSWAVVWDLMVEEEDDEGKNAVRWWFATLCPFSATQLLDCWSLLAVPYFLL